MIRTVIWFVYFWLYQLWAYPKLKKANALLAAERIQERDEMVHKLVLKWSNSLLDLAGCSVTVMGKEHLDVKGPVLFVANHQSNFDIPILLAKIDLPKGFIAKAELEKMPIVSEWMNHIHCVFMNRENVRQSAVAINQGISFLKEGYNMVIFPEGTRSLDGELLEFKPGALKLATKPGVPIIPITIDGSIHMMKKDSKKIVPAKVDLIIHEPILPSEYEGMDTGDLSEKIKQMIHNSKKIS